MQEYSIRKLSVDDYASYYPLINEFRKTEFTEGEFKEYINTLPSNIEIYVLVIENEIV